MLLLEWHAEVVVQCTTTRARRTSHTGRASSVWYTVVFTSSCTPLRIESHTRSNQERDLESQCWRFVVLFPPEKSVLQYLVVLFPEPIG